MDVVIHALRDYLTPGAAIGSAVLGLVIGTTYAWQHRADVTWLWTTGIAFITVLGVYAYLEVTTTAIGISIARAINWTIVALAIVVGSRLRSRFAAWRIRRRTAASRRRSS